jgi:type IV fimbrial biogenesis protein FimT
MRARGAGFTVVEAAVVLVIIGILMAVGMPSMSNFLLGRKAAAAAVFYQDGLAFARNQAIVHNSNSRLVLVENAANGQMDWRVDLCVQTTDVICDDDHGSWSTTSSPVLGFKSVLRSAAALPAESAMAQSFLPSGATEIYFTPLGWIDSRVTPRLTRIDLAPTRANAFKPLAIVVTLAGIASVCDPNAVLHGTRRCPP